MGRTLPIDSEVVSGGHKAMTENVKPDPIHHHSRCQRIRGAGDQFGKLAPSASKHLETVIGAGNELQKSALDCLAGMRGVTRRQHREIVAWVEVRYPLEDLRRADTRFGNVILFDQVL